MNLRTRIKFCGMRRVEDALAASALGVDAVGIVLTQKSIRFVELDAAARIRAALPPLVCAVALFMDDDPGWIGEALAAVRPALVQFHGVETAEDCIRHGLPYVKAVPMGGGLDVHAVISAHPAACAFLLDGHRAGEQGGGGRRFDWSAFPSGVDRPLMLAGGLTCDNVAAAVRQARPYAVDVSSGIESAPGIKDAAKMRRFAAEVARANGDFRVGSENR